MILQRYILKELLVSVLMTLATVLFLLLLVAIFQAMRAYSILGLDFLARAALSTAVYTFPFALVVAAGVGATLAYGRLSADREIDAMRASGYSATRVLTPALWLGLVAAAGSYAINEYAAPRAHYENRLLLAESVLGRIQSLPPGPGTIDIGSLKLSYKDVKKGVLVEPRLKRTGPDNVLLERYDARSGIIKVEPGKPVAITLEDLKYVKTDPDGTVHRGEAGSFTYEIEVAELRNRPRKPADMSRAELLSYIAKPDLQQDDLHKARTEYYSRYAESLAPLLLILLGGCVGILTRKGNRMAGLGAAVPIVMGYFVLWMLGKGFGEKNVISSGIAVALPDAVLLVAILVIHWRIMRR